MKRYRLSSLGERIAAVLISFILIVFMIFLAWILRGDLLSLIICILASLLVSAALIFYVMNLFKAACIPHQEDTVLEVKGYPDSFLFLADIVSLETAPFKNGPVTTRTLVFKNAKGEVAASLPTFFTSHEGAQAEPMAMELAQDLGIQFTSTLEPWEYDPQPRKAHRKQQAQAEREARRERIRSLKEKLLRKTGAAKPTPAPSEEKVEEIDFEELPSDGINYDAMDDEK